MDKLTIHVPVPGVVADAAKRMRARVRAKAPDLTGDRDVEWSFVASQMPPGPGRALDVGSGGSYLSLIAARKGYEVVALDLREQRPPWHHPAVRHAKEDVRALSIDEASLDLVINCSSIEHVGLAGRYGVRELDAEGDLKGMEQLHRALRPGGRMLLTIPVGRDAVVMPLHRIYGPKRLPLLLRGFETRHAEFWIKERRRWVRATEEDALAFDAGPRRAELYALGCFVLTRPSDGSEGDG